MTQKEYNGWYNYETWLVNLWIGNDEGSQSYADELTGQAYKDARAERSFTRDERATLNLSDSLKEWIEEQNPLADNANLFSDLLSGALSEVNWHEIAEHYIEDFDKSDYQDEETDDEDEQEVETE